MKGDEDYNPNQSLVAKSLGDSLYQEAKAISGGLPFPGGGWGGGSSVYSSWDSWDASIDMRMGGKKGGIPPQEYLNRLGDLSNNSLICAAIRWVSNAIQEAILVVKEKEGAEGGAKGESITVKDHPLTMLWNRPNDHYSGATLRKAIAFSWVLRSEAYILKSYNEVGTEVLELWWEPHWTIRPVWPLDGSQFIAYYEVNRNGIWYKVPTENVIHLRDGLNPYNQRIGFSSIPSILPELYGDAEAAAYYATLMGGSAIPPFLVSIDKDLRMGEPEVEAFTRRLIDKTTGRKRGQPIVAKGAKAYKLGWNPRELDLRETRYMAEDRFCAVMGIPAVVLELGTGQAHAIYNNVKQAEKRAWNSYMNPMLNQIQEELTVQFLADWEEKESGRYCEHDTSKVEALQEDQKSKAEIEATLYEKGVIMRSEARSRLGYGPSNPDNPDADKVWAVMSAAEKQVADEKAADRRAQEREQRWGNLGQIGAPNARRKQLTGQTAAVSLIKALLTTTDDREVTWKEFPETWQSLGIERASMPQVKSEHRGAMVRFLKGRGIAHTVEEVLPGILRPSQKDYSPEKVQRAREYEGKWRPLLVSRDSYVADGHHQWVSSLDNEGEKIKIIRFDCDIIELLLEIARFPSSGVALMKALEEEEI